MAQKKVKLDGISLSPALQSLKQDCYKFYAGMGYTVRFRQTDGQRQNGYVLITKNMEKGENSTWFGQSASL